MKRNFVKVIGAFVTIIAMSIVFTACSTSKETECEECHKVKKCYEYEYSKLLMGGTETGWLCDDCADEYESIMKRYDGVFKKK